VVRRNARMHTEAGGIEARRATCGRARHG
jgi:hypothetical protein